MPRWEGVALAVVLAAAGCHHAVSGAGGDAGDDADAGCSCDLVQGGVSVSVACGAVTCSSDTLYLCSEGSFIIEGVCGDGGDGVEGGGPAGEGGPEGGQGCLPQCNGVTCGQPDTCGSVCKCDPGVTCMAGMCGNGCQELAGSPCLPGTTNPSTCCQQGNQCATADSGASVCCALATTGTFLGGLCSMDTDCCGYPIVRCNPGTGTCQ